MSAPKQQLEIAHTEIAGASDSAEGSGSLPSDVVSMAGSRLRIASVVFFGTFVVAYSATWALLPRDIMPVMGKPVAHVGALIAFFASVFVFRTAKSACATAKALEKLGHVYLVLTCLAVTLAELSTPLAAGEVPRGNSWIVYWIVVFPAIVPSSARKMLIAGTIAASMAPLALMTTAILEGRYPSASQAMLVLFPNYIAAVTGSIVAGVVHRLGREISKARELGNYRLVEKLGGGGMGEVWRAEHRLLVRPAAVKLVRPELLGVKNPAQKDAVEKRFEREAQATALLGSPHTVELYDFGVARDGTFYYAMELLDGMDLETLVSTHGPLPVARALNLLEQICDSLGDAHEQGLLHRDVKPANIYVCRRGLQTDYVKVLDFGLVRPVQGDDSTKLTADNAVTGTPAFISPEQANGESDLDARSDLYALGCVAFYLLTGKLVFEASTSMMMLVKHLTEEAKAPSVHTPEIPRALDALVLDCLRKNRDDRPSSAVELASRIRQICEAEGIERDEAAIDRWWTEHAPARPKRVIGASRSSAVRL